MESLASIKSRISSSLRLNLLLSSRNESVFKSSALNWENFSLTCVSGWEEGGFISLHNSPSHHAAKGLVPTNFSYYPSENVYITAPSACPYPLNGVFGSTSVYSDLTLLSSVPSQSSVDIIGQTTIHSIERNVLCNLIKSGAIFRIFCECENGVFISLNVDLFMLNEDGEFTVNLSPFYGCLSDILNPDASKTLIQNIKIMCDKYNFPKGIPPFDADPRSIHDAYMRSDRVPRNPVSMESFPNPLRQTLILPSLDKEVSSLILSCPGINSVGEVVASEKLTLSSCTLLASL